MLRFKLPVAPPLNNAFGNKRYGGRYKTGRYRAWIRNADAHVLLQRLRGDVPAPFRVRMLFPANTPGDLDNRGKLILDYLVSRAVTPDVCGCHETGGVRSG